MSLHTGGSEAWLSAGQGMWSAPDRVCFRAPGVLGSGGQERGLKSICACSQGRWLIGDPSPIRSPLCAQQRAAHNDETGPTLVDWGPPRSEEPGFPAKVLGSILFNSHPSGNCILIQQTQQGEPGGASLWLVALFLAPLWNIWAP